MADFKAWSHSVRKANFSNVLGTVHKFREDLIVQEVKKIVIVLFEQSLP